MLCSCWIVVLKCTVGLFVVFLLDCRPKVHCRSVSCVLVGLSFSSALRVCLLCSCWIVVLKCTVGLFVVFLLDCRPKVHCRFVCCVLVGLSSSSAL